MNEQLSQLVKQVREIWGGMTLQRRILLAGAAAAVFLVLAVITFSLSRGPRYEVLFSQLAPADAAEVLQQLDESGIPYRIEQGPQGYAVILVPPEAVYRTRIQLAAQGIPSRGSVGFEIFDQSQFGMTEDVRRINLRRALAGELERTIRAIDAVQDARVQLSIPEERLFISQQQSPTAAVMVTLRPGRRLSAEQVRAIQRLVASTVEGLDPDDVFVADNLGNPLSDQLAQLSSASGVTQVEKQLLIQSALSSEYARQIRSLLEGPFGVGRVEAMVNVEINFEMAEEIIKAFEAPNGTRGIVRSQQVIEESFEGQGAPPGGVPGVESNIPGFPAVAAATGESEYFRSEEIINYEINETQVRRVIPPGAIRRISVAVLIDGDLTDAQEAAVASTIASALGIDPARGDRVSVDSLPFAASVALASAAEEAARTIWGLPAQYAYAAAALLAILVLLYWQLRRRRAESARGVDVVVDEEEVLLPERELTTEERRRQHMREQLIRMAKESPKEIAKLIRSWLMEE